MTTATQSRNRLPIGAVSGLRKVIGIAETRLPGRKTGYVVECQCGRQDVVTRFQFEDTSACKSCAFKKYTIGEIVAGVKIVYRLSNGKGFLVVCQLCGRRSNRMVPAVGRCMCQRGQIVLTLDGVGYRVRCIAKLLGLTVEGARHLLGRSKDEVIERVRRAVRHEPEAPAVEGK